MLLCGGVAALLLAGIVLWLRWGNIHAWYVVRGLKQADEDALPMWVERAVALGPAAADTLLQGLAEDGPAGDNCAEALTAMAAQWGPGDERAEGLAARAVKLCPTLPPAGRSRAIRVLAGCVGGCGPAVREACVPLLEEADDAALESALALAAKLLPEASQALPAARRLAQAGLASTSEGAKVAAISLAHHPGLGLLDQVAGLLKGGSPAVRRAVVLAIGPGDTREEMLLSCLHDEDAGVRELAAAALQGRGLRPEQIELGRLITHPKAHSRLLVLDKLREVPDIDPAAWLRRLSQDASPCVRAAALRVISEHLAGEMSDRIEEMARTDPSPTVAQLAHYYLGVRRDLIPAGGPRR
jgi:hypothetical protein